MDQRASDDSCHWFDEFNWNLIWAGRCIISNPIYLPIGLATTLGVIRCSLKASSSGSDGCNVLIKLIKSSLGSVLVDPRVR